MSFWEFGREHIAQFLPSSATNAVVNARRRAARTRCGSSGGAAPSCSPPTPRCSPGSASGAPCGPTSADARPLPGPSDGRRRRRPVCRDHGGPAVAASRTTRRATACRPSSGDRLDRVHPTTPTSRERGASAVAEQSPSSDPLTSFGPNEWLVDELYEQYQKDSNSVDRAWWDFFKDYTPGEGALGRDAGRRRAPARPPATGAAPPDQRRRRSRRPGQGADPGRRPRARAGHPPRRPAPAPAAPRPPAPARPAAPAAPAPRPRRQGGARAPGPSPRQPPTPEAARGRGAQGVRPAQRRHARPPSAAPAPASSPTWRPRSRCPPPPRCARCPPSCSSTTASSSTTTSPAAAAAR